MDATNQDTTNPLPNEENNMDKEGSKNVPLPAASATTPRRKSQPASKNSVTSGKSGGKTKNSSNKDEALSSRLLTVLHHHLKMKLVMVENLSHNLVC
jgi:hypothetical protein